MRQKKYSPAEPVTDLKRIKIVDNGEPLVPVLGRHPQLVEAEPRFLYTRVFYLRETVADMLIRAAGELPKGYALALVEGWRPPYIQRRMYLSAWRRWKKRHPDWSDVKLKRVVNRFTAPLHGKVPPPHSTGAALDVMLAKNGEELVLSEPYEPMDAAAYPLDAPGLTDEAREGRQVLSEALLAGGLTNYASEWWHWSHGDQGWAYRTGAEHALYGPTEPLDWEPIAADDNDQVLERAAALKG